MNWTKVNTKKDLPKENGEYLTISYLGIEKEIEYGNLAIYYFIHKGTKLTYDCVKYNSNHADIRLKKHDLSPEEKLLEEIFSSKLIAEETGWYSEEMDNNGKLYLYYMGIDCISHYTNLNNIELPDPYKDCQNKFLDYSKSV